MFPRSHSSLTPGISESVNPREKVLRQNTIIGFYWDLILFYMFCLNVSISEDLEGVSELSDYVISGASPGLKFKK